MKLGIIGAGWISSNAHLPACRYNGIDVQVIVDCDISKAIALSRAFSVPYYEKEVDNLWKYDLDGVIIATPNHTHYQLTREALLHGKHVLCEKPITIKHSEAVELCQIAQNRNLILMPGFVNRYREDIKIIKKVIEAGSIGEIRHVDAGWIRSNGVPRPGTWFTNKECAGGGVLIDLGSHILDIICQLIDKDISKETVDFKLEVSSAHEKMIENSAEWFQENQKEDLPIDVEDYAAAQLHLKNDITVECNVAWCSKLKGDCTYFQICGRNGIVVLYTLFGFSHNRLFNNPKGYIEKKDGSRIAINIDFADMQTNAFNNMLNAFKSLVLTENQDEGDNSVSDSVYTLENLYKNAQIINQCTINEKWEKIESLLFDENNKYYG